MSPVPLGVPPALDLALDLDWVAPGLAVGGAIPPGRIAELPAIGVGAVIDLRREDRDDEGVLAGHGIAFLHLPTEDHRALTQADMDRGVAWARDHAGPGLLVHCREGIGRSVTLALCILVDRGDAPLAALERIKDARVWASPSPPQFDAFAEWLARRGVPPPPFEALAAVAYRHLR